jgi:hypothetical protein
VIQLKKGNDVGVDYWAIEPLGPTGTCSHVTEVRFTDGERVPFWYPSGCKHAIWITTNDWPQH